MKRFTSEELVLTLGAHAGDKDLDPEPPTTLTCANCCPKTAPPQPKPHKKSDARAWEQDLGVLQRQLAGILES